MSLNGLPVQTWLTAGLLTGLFALAGYVVPDLRLIFSLFWAVPLVFVVKRHGLLPGILATTLVGIIVGIAVGPLIGLLAILEIGSLGLVMGLLYKNAVPAKRILLISTVVAILIQLPILAANYANFDTNNPQVRQEMERQRTEYINIFKQAGVIGTPDGPSELEFGQTFEYTWRLSLQLLPGVSIIMAFLSVWANYKFAYYYLRRRNQILHDDLPLNLWRFPWYTIWGLIIGLTLLLLGQGTGALDVFGKNIVLVSLFFNLMMGLGVLGYFLFRSALPKFLKVIVVLILLLNLPLGFLLLISIGTFDPVFNFRRLPAEMTK